MTASFHGPLSLKEKLVAVTMLLSLIAWHSPVIGKAYAATSGSEEQLVFEIKSSTKLQNTDTATAADQAQAAQKAAFAKIDKKVALVRAYLESKNSPLANYTEILLAQDDWQRIIAISNSESNMGLHCYRQFNCSGIFTDNGLKVYHSMPEWIVDMQGLIDKRYKNMSLKQMNGIYVQPASYNWLAASTSVYKDLDQIENQVDQEFPSQTATANTAIPADASTSQQI